ncbi:calcineurin B, partial [Reticulomyxa filosa]
MEDGEDEDEDEDGQGENGKVYSHLLPCLFKCICLFDLNDNPALNYLQRVLKLADEDGDGKVDFVEFADAVDDLGVDVDQEQLQFIFAHWAVDEKRQSDAQPLMVIQDDAEKKKDSET